MAMMPDDFVDLTVTSPPYDNLRQYKGYDFPFEAIAKELLRITKQGGVVVWIVGDATINEWESGSSFKQALFFMELGFKLHDTMIYMKSGPSYPSQNKYYQVFEYMFVLVKGSLKTFNPLKDRENRWYGKKWSKVRTRRNSNDELKRMEWTSDEGDKFGSRFNIWQYAVGARNQGDKIAHQHPATFPEALAGDHILSWTNEGDLVYDCFGGSGTTAKMAHILKRNWITSEISPDYCLLMEKRLKPYLAQLILI